MNQPSLDRGLQALRRRAIGVATAAGAGRGLVALLALLAAWMWADLALDLPPAARVAAVLAASACGVAWLVVALVRSMRTATPQAMASQLDAAAASRGQIRSGVDLFLHSRATPAGAGGAAATLSAGLGQLAIDRAAALARAVSPAAAISARPATQPFKVLGVMCLAAGMLALAVPRLVATQWLRFADPYGDHPPYSSLVFHVDPGHAKVLYGRPLDIRVSTEGGQAEELELVVEPQAPAAGPQVVPMFPQPDGTWQATLASVTEPGRYFVRADRARTKRFGLGVITVPKLEDVRVRVTPPVYTNLPPYEGPMPQAGLAGLVGTTVEVTARSNRPLAGGAMRFIASAVATAGAPAAPATQPSVERAWPAPMAAVAPRSDTVKGSFTIDRPGKVVLHVTDVAGQDSTEAFAVPVTVLLDGRPFVRVLEPRAEALATPDVTIDVSVLAEDDYGVSRVQLFRSLNDSRALPADVSVPAPPPTRAAAHAPLRLADYGLSPGDVVKLFARVEDNDPAGPKGAESSVVTIRIISQQEMEKLMLARDGMEVLQSKYEQAARRIEGLQDEIRKLQEELSKLDPNSELAAEQREKLAKLAADMEKAAAEIAKLADQPLPLDLDKALNEHLEKLAAATKDAAANATKASQMPRPNTAGVQRELDELAKALGECRGEFQKETTEPLEHLARIYPLLEKEAAFVQLYERQRDLAERMASLQGQDAADDPKLKARMRDLEEEQRQLRRDLRDLIDDIEAHAQQLPDDPRLDDLRKTAEAFVQAARASDAAAQMNSAETALGEFAGTRAHAAAHTAADELEKLLAPCQSTGESGQACLRFQPQLAAGLGSTVQQLLDAAGMKPGMGAGGGGGYSARRSTLTNVGLYGHLPVRGDQARSGTGGRANRGTSADGRGDADSLADPAGVAAADQTRITGASDAAVPVRYRRRVGEYFQRVAEELGQDQ